MSKTIDERVVEMRFDNQQFEKNVQTSMSTLEKLKQKLNLTGASKSLENVNKAAKNVTLTGLSNAVETVHAKFSALQVMGVTTLANITNSAVNAGKRITSALTIDPIKTGFQEYETQINAVQTILANTQSKGSTIKDVNKALDELNTYADQTIYNFTEMTRNIGTFTAAGVDLDKSVTSIKGIANLAAVSGSSSQQASTAMYQLSQALAAGKVSLMDWNSVVNAGMGGQVFQDALKRTAENMGTNVDALIKKYGSFRESLTQGEWLTADVLTETLTQLSGAYTKADLIAQGYTEKQAKEILELAETAKNAATKVKTFTQLWDVLKESAQSGWTQTWELIFGDFEQAKSLFSPLAEFLTGVINGMSEARNKLLEGALASPFGKLAEKIEKVTGATEKMKSATKDYGDIVDRVIGGEFGTGQSRWDKLTKAGYDWAKVQNLVNKKLGSSKKHTEQLTEAQKNQNGTQSTTIEQLVKMSDAQLKSLGFTKDEIEAFRELETQSEKTGIPINKLIKDMDQLDGRTLLINSFKNAGSGLIGIFKAMAEAWREIFPPMTSTQLYNIIAGMHKLSTNLRLTDAKTGELTETGENLKRTLKGVFAIIGMITDITGGGLKIAFKLLNSILKYFDTDILKVTASMGDAIVAFRKATDISKLFDIAIEKIAPALQKTAKGIRGLTDAFLELPFVKGIIDSVKDSLSKLEDLNFKEIGKNIIDGLTIGLGDGGKQAIDAIVNLGKSIIEGIKTILGIHSPSTVFMAIGGFIIAGLILGLQNGAPDLLNSLGGIGTMIAETLGKINWGKIFAGGMSIGMLLTIKKIADALSALASPFEGLGSVFESTANVLDKSAKGIGKILKSFSKVLSSFAFSIKAKAIKNIAISLAILIGAIALLSLMDTNKLWEAVGIVAAIAGILIVLVGVVEGLAILSKKFGSGSIDFGKLTLGLLGISASVLLLGIAAKMIGSLKPEQAKQGFIGLAGLVIAIASVLGVYGFLVKGKSAQNIDKVGKMLRKMAFSMLMMVTVVKLISLLSKDELIKGGIVIGAFVVIVALLSKISTIAGRNADKLGNMMIKLSISMILMVGVIKLISGLSEDELNKGGKAILAFTGVMLLLTLISRIGKDTIGKLSGTLIAMSASMLIMVGVIKLISTINPKMMTQGLKAIGIFTAIIFALCVAIKIVGPNAPKLAGTLLAMSVAIGILAGVSILLGLVDVDSLKQGIIAVGFLSLFIGGLIWATKGANDCKGNLIAMSVAIGIMAAAVIALSFIDGTKLAGATIALGSLMGVFAHMTKMAGAAQKSMGSLIVLTVLVGVLGGMLYLLSSLPIESLSGVTTALTTLILSLSAMMFVIGKAGTITPMTLVAVGAMVLVVGLLGGLLYLMKDLPVESTLGIAASLSMLLLSMSGVLGILTVIGLGGPAALIGIGSLAALIVGIGGLITIIGALVTKFPQLEEFLNTGIPILEKIGYALGSFFGNIVDGFVTEATDGLPTLGTNLSNFMTNIQPFINGAKNIDPAMMEGVKALAETILILTKADILEGLTSWLTGGSSLENFGSQLGSLATSLNTFATNLGTFDEAKVTTITCAAKAIKILAESANALPNEGGLWAKIAGDNSLATFGSQLGGLATNINNFVTNLGTFDEAKVTTVGCAAKAIKVLAKAATELPNEGGLWAKIAGDNSLATFGSQLGGLAINLNLFATNLGTFDDAKVTTIGCASEAIKTLAKAANEIPNEGGWLSKIVGDNSISTFGSYLPSLGTNLNTFATNLGTFNDAKVTTVTCAANAIKMLAQAAQGIPNEGGWLSKIVGDNSIDTFGSKLASLGTNIKEFATNASGVSVEKMKSAVSALTALTKLAKVDIAGAGDNMKAFGTNLVSFSKKLTSFGTNMGKISDSSISTAISKTKELVSLVKSLGGVDTSGAKAFADSLKTIGQNSVKNFTDAFTSGSTKAKIKNAATTLILTFIVGAKLKQAAVKTAFTSIANNALSGVKNETNYTNFKSAGSYLVSGFCSGISANTYKAKAKASAMAAAAAAAAKKKLDIHSPSRVFYKIGDNTGRGFVNALDHYASIAYKSGSDMADSARIGLSNAISRITNIINNDIDAQPTIRPVLDLSAVESGAGAINGMFGQGLTLGASADIDTISSMMNSSIQNGGNAEVVSAINKLRKDLSNVGNTSYNISGITYDDGSNISEAVQSLVRAAKMERRI